MDPWKLLDRFLVFGTEGGTFRVLDQPFTIAQVPATLSLIKTDGVQVVERIVEVSKSGRAPKNAPAIFALALATAFGDTKTRQSAFSALPPVCRTGTQLFQFVADADQLRGWGRGMRKAIANWYITAEIEELTNQALKHQHFGGWSHRDLLRLSHPKPPTEGHRVLFKWIVDEELVGPNPKIEAYERLLNREGEPGVLIREHRLNRECIPTELLTQLVVWDALLQDMTITEMMRNLANMTRCGLLTTGSKATNQVVEKLTNETLLRRARTHPIALLIGYSNYVQGLRDSGTIEPVPTIVDALNSAFYLAFGAVEPTDKRIVLGIDVSGSMCTSTVAGSPLSACEAATAIALVTVATESVTSPMAFADNFRNLPIQPSMLLAHALKLTRNVNFGGVDCALPMLWATKNKVMADVFVVYTDTEATFGKVPPAQALDEYRQKTGIAAKLVVVSMCANRSTLADSRDPGILEVVGFDTSVPQAIRQFAQS